MNVLSDERKTKKIQVEKHISIPNSKGFWVSKTKTNFVPTLLQDAPYLQFIYLLLAIAKNFVK